MLPEGDPRREYLEAVQREAERVEPRGDGRDGRRGRDAPVEREEHDLVRRDGGRQREHGALLVALAACGDLFTEASNDADLFEALERARSVHFNNFSFLQHL